MKLSPRLNATACKHDSVKLEWPSVNGCNTYVVEEKDSYGVGTVFVGHSQECTLHGLQPMSEHQYRMKCEVGGETFTTPWLIVFTNKEPVSCEHLIRACRSSDLIRLRRLMAELEEQGSQRKMEVLNSLDAKGITPLMTCAIDDFEMGACLLLENGADINIRNNDGKCALTMATLHGNDAMISLLLANGANIAVQDRSGSNLLFSASDSAEALEVLLNEKVIDVNGKNSTGWAPLHKIASVNDSHDSDKCTALLIKNGADIESKDLHGNTPLSLAVITGNVTVTRALLELGASRVTQNIQNNSPERLALANEFNKGTRSKQIAALFKQT